MVPLPLDLVPDEIASIITGASIGILLVASLLAWGTRRFLGPASIAAKHALAFLSIGLVVFAAHQAAGFWDALSGSTSAETAEGFLGILATAILSAAVILLARAPPTDPGARA